MVSNTEMIANEYSFNDTILDIPTEMNFSIIEGDDSISEQENIDSIAEDTVMFPNETATDNFDEPSDLNIDHFRTIHENLECTVRDALTII